jgi:hypothetical protein
VDSLALLLLLLLVAPLLPFLHLLLNKLTSYVHGRCVEVPLSSCRILPTGVNVGVIRLWARSAIQKSLTYKHKRIFDFNFTLTGCR